MSWNIPLPTGPGDYKVGNPAPPSRIQRADLKARDYPFVGSSPPIHTLTGLQVSWAPLHFP